MNKKIIIVIVIVAIIGVLVWKNSTKKVEPVVETPTQALEKATSADTNAAIDANLKSIDVTTSTDEDLKAIDEDLKSL